MFAAESYLENRNVRWSRPDGTCLEGRWYAEDGLICFVYETNPDPQCWSTSVAPQGLTAHLMNTDAPVSLFEGDGTDIAFDCLGPRIGA